MYSSTGIREEVCYFPNLAKKVGPQINILMSQDNMLKPCVNMGPKVNYRMSVKYYVVSTTHQFYGYELCNLSQQLNTLWECRRM